MFSALSVRNFRLFFVGQAVSVSGTWMQRTAQSWLVLDLTGSGVAVGGVIALQFLPILVLALFGGLTADRVDKRRLLYLTQTLAGVIAACLGLLVLTGLIQLWMVYLLAFLLGAVDSFDNPARQGFVMEMVGRDRLANAVGLYAVMINVARVAGPALGGFLIVTVGLGMCFLLNSVSYLALLLGLALMDASRLERPPAKSRQKGQLRELIPYVRGMRELLVPLVVTALVSIFAYEFEVSLPLWRVSPLKGMPAPLA